MKLPIAFRLSADAVNLIRTLADRLGLSQAGVVELAIRLLAKEQKVSLLEKKDRIVIINE